jgi:hypothetical protein
MRTSSGNTTHRASTFGVGATTESWYPVSEWNKQLRKYSEYWNHFNGDWLQERLEDSETLVYPLQLNPMNMACMLHASFLFGEVKDSSPSQVPMNVETWGDSEGVRSDRDRRLTEYVNRVWYESEGRAIQLEGGIMSQVLGGTVFSVAYDPKRITRGYLPIRVDLVTPEVFFPIYSYSDYELLETIIAYQVTAGEAKLKYKSETMMETPLYYESWTEDDYEVQVGGNTVNYLGYPMKGKPLGNLIPYVYIPHVRVGNFYGESLLHNKLGIVKEINSRYADVGDTIMSTAAQFPWIASAPNVTIRDLGHGQIIGDLGASYPGAPEAPRIFFPQGGALTPPAVQWAQELLTTARIESYTPPILYGQDEGSQRSALTLAVRMIPLVKHVQQERAFWSTALSRLAMYMLRMAAAQESIKEVQPQDIQNIRVWPDWQPMVPRDAQTELNEIILQVHNKLMSPQTGMERLGQIQDVKTEMNLIKMFTEEFSPIMNATQNGNPFAGTGQDGEQAQAERPKQPKPSINKPEE